MAFWTAVICIFWNLNIWIFLNMQLLVNYRVLNRRNLHRFKAVFFYFWNLNIWIFSARWWIMTFWTAVIFIDFFQMNHGIPSSLIPFCRDVLAIYKHHNVRISKTPPLHKTSKTIIYIKYSFSQSVHKTFKSVKLVHQTFIYYSSKFHHTLEHLLVHY